METRGSITNLEMGTRPSRSWKLGSPIQAPEIESGASRKNGFEVVWSKKWFVEDLAGEGRGRDFVH